MRNRGALFLFVFIVFLLFSSKSMAASYSLLLGGEADTKNQSYLYTGIIGERPIKQNLSILGRLWFDHLRYRFEKGDDTIRANAPAFQTSLGVKFSESDWSTVLWAGWEHRNTSIKPFKEDIEVKGVTDSLIVQVEFDKWPRAATNLNLITSYSTTNNYIWARGRVKQKLSSNSVGRDIPLRVGFEVIGQGNDDYSALQFGPLAEIYSTSEKFSFLIHGGYKKSSSIHSSAYGGIELYFGF